MISVIVPALINTNKQLAMSIKLLESAKQLTSIPFNLVVVETESDHLREYCDFHIYEAKKSTCTKSINRGFRLLESEFKVLLTNDVNLKPGWLDALLHCFSNKKDCGIATLATTQLNHSQRDEIEEGIWFSVAMFLDDGEYFDEGYVNSWDDTDFIMRRYLKGQKMYRNFNVVVDHKPGQTEYAKPDHVENFNKNRERFIKKFGDSNHPMYQRLISGEVI